MSWGSEAGAEQQKEEGDQNPEELNLFGRGGDGGVSGGQRPTGRRTLSSVKT